MIKSDVYFGTLERPVLGTEWQLFPGMLHYETDPYWVRLSIFLYNQEVEQGSTKLLRIIGAQRNRQGRSGDEIVARASPAIMTPDPEVFPEY